MLNQVSRVVAPLVAALVVGAVSCGIEVDAPGGGGSAAIPAPDGGSIVPPGDSGIPSDDGGSPVLTSGLRVVVGGDNSCVVSATGGAACWGSGELGQLGLLDFADHATPRWIGISHVADLAVGDFAICQEAPGQTFCAGMNTYGEIGSTTGYCKGPNTSCGESWTGVPDPGTGALVAGPHLFCTVQATAGTVHCWGAGSMWDGVGYHVLSMASGDSHTCVVFAPGPGQDPARNVACTGDNLGGQHGDGTSTSAGPSQVASGAMGGFVEIAAGLSFTCGVSAVGELFCWGENVYGQLGVGFSDGADFPESCPTQGACATHPTRVQGLPRSRTSRRTSRKRAR